MAGGIRAHRLDLLRTRRIAGGLRVSDLARLANVSDELINKVENGDPCPPDITERLLDALGPSVAITSSSTANPTVLLTAAHKFVVGDTVTIASHTGASVSLNGDQAITASSDTTHFTVAVDESGGGGTGGTARLSPTSLGIARL